MSASNRRRQRGFSLVELMVSIVISLLVALAALGMARFFMTSQRQASSIGSASANAASALAALKYEASNAGLGFYARGLQPCAKLNLSNKNLKVPLHLDGADFEPFSVGGTATSAALTLSYATAIEASVPVKVAADTSSEADSVKTDGYLPVAVGQAVMLAPGDATAGTCTIRTVTATGAGAVPTDLTFAATGMHNTEEFGAKTVYPAGSMLYLMGSVRRSVFKLDGTNLVMERPFENDKSVVIARDVVAFSVQYGVSEDGVSWVAADPAQNLSKVKALRIGIVAKADQKEKPDASGNCTATADKPVLFGTTVTPPGDDWQCFRYRDAHAIVPLRNMLIGFPTSTPS